MEQFNYKAEKGGYLIFANGKPKVKVRKWISNLSKDLQGMNGDNFELNRSHLKIAFIRFGVDGVKTHFMGEVEKYNMRIREKQKVS